MFKTIIDAIKNFFATLFGSKKTTEAPRPIPRPQPSAPETQIPQDASEVQPDSLVVVANEMDRIIIPPNEPDKEADDDVAVEPPKQETPAPQPEPPKPTTPPQPEVVPTPQPEPGTDLPKHKPRYLWCLDNGHGKKTPGKRSPLFDDGKTRFMEYEFNRDIVKRIIEQLDEVGVKYFNVVPEVDIDDFLAGRVERANNKKSELPKLFVSVHSNASPAANMNTWGLPTVSGIETWYYHGSRRGQKLAAIFHKYLIDETGFKNRHLKSKPEGQFYVLRKTNMTSILTENGFYNNKMEAMELM
ncbi:MAG: N-acetylmuramoyl-L-alanine amidase [Saprospiraceae bacterium]